MFTLFSIRALGCKVNHYESQQVRELLQSQGLQPATRNQQPDLIILHTCCVTATASAKSRQSIRRLQKQHPHATVVVCGCLPSTETPDLDGLDSNVLVIRDRQALANELGSLTRQTTTRTDHSSP